mmetsp:Transcript_8330/g.26533  ORF Transcript_8330/g.26533 Transcript_8330/m.26533 type:complete len:257 (+) Transcript_8330:324-1094(+)
MVRLHARDGQLHQRHGRLLQLCRARHGRQRLRAPPAARGWPGRGLAGGRREGGPAAALDGELDVLISEVVEQAVATQDEDVAVLHWRRADHGALDDGVCVQITEAVEALHLHGSSRVVAPWLGLEDRPETQGHDAAGPQDQQCAVPEARCHEVRGPQDGQQKRGGAVDVRGVVGLLDKAREPCAVVRLRASPACSSVDLRAAAVQKVPGELVRRDAQVVHPRHAVADAEVRQPLLHSVRVGDSGVGLRRVLLGEGG